MTTNFINKLINILLFTIFKWTIFDYVFFADEQE